MHLAKNDTEMKFAPETEPDQIEYENINQLSPLHQDGNTGRHIWFSDH